MELFGDAICVEIKAHQTLTIKAMLTARQTYFTWQMNDLQNPRSTILIKHNLHLPTEAGA